MVVLGKFPGKYLVHLGAAVMFVTIILCYVIAVMEGHVVPWLPTISECGENAPEEFFFRFGIHTGALLLVVLALYIYTADFPFSRDVLNVTMGVIAALCLGVVAICASNEDNVVHTTCAVIFFVLEDLLVLRITIQSHGSSLSPLSISIKTFCTAVAWITSIGRVMYMMDYLPGDIRINHWLDVPVLPILEWSDTLAVLAFHWSFAYDFSPFYYVAAWKSEKTGKMEKI